jgi:hypothetical protein
VIGDIAGLKLRERKVAGSVGVVELNIKIDGQREGGGADGDVEQADVSGCAGIGGDGGGNFRRLEIRVNIFIGDCAADEGNLNTDGQIERVKHGDGRVVDGDGAGRIRSILLGFLGANQSEIDQQQRISRI